MAHGASTAIPTGPLSPKNTPGQGTRARVARFVVAARRSTSGRIPERLRLGGSITGDDVVPGRLDLPAGVGERAGVVDHAVDHVPPVLQARLNGQAAIGLSR